MRAIWIGSLSFGLVNIPVKLYSAVESKGLDFRMLRRDDFCPISYSKVCKHTGEKVERDEIVKGFEVEKDEYVILEKEDFEKANLEKTNTIDIVGFTKEDEIDTKYFERPYFLEPDKKAEKPYALLREALRKTGKVGIARFVLRNHEHIGAVKTEGDVLYFNQMRFFDEIRQPDDLNLPRSAEAKNNEIKMAVSLIGQMTQKFDPKKYNDTYTEELKSIIEAKAKGKKPKAKGKSPTPTEVENLMQALKASLEEGSEKEKVR